MKKMMQEQFFKFFDNQKKFRETEKDVFVQRKNKSEKKQKGKKKQKEKKTGGVSRMKEENDVGD